MQIIRHLLKSYRLSHGEIANLCGYTIKGKNKYRFISTPLKELIGEGYLEKISGYKNGGAGAPATVYWIKPDLEVVKSLYFKEDFQPLRDEIRQSKWIRNLILQENFKISINIENVFEDMHLMLENSENFFEIFLNNQYNEENILKLESTFIYPISNKSELYEGRLIECRSERISFMLYSLFITCIIADYLDKGKINPIPLNIQEKVKEIKKKAHTCHKKCNNIKIPLK